MAKNKLIDLIEEREKINKEIRETREKEKTAIGNYIISIFDDIDMTLEDFKEKDMNTSINLLLKNYEDNKDYKLINFYFNKKELHFESEREFTEYALKNYISGLAKSLEKDEALMREFRELEEADY